MTLLRGEPRAVYRVYDEDEYLSGAAGDREAVDRVDPVTGPRRPGRAAALAILVGALGALAGLLVLDGTRSRAGRRSEPASRAAVGMTGRRPQLGRGQGHGGIRGTDRRRVNTPRAGRGRTGYATRRGGSLAAAAIDEPRPGALASSDAPGAAGAEFGFER